MHVHTDDGTIKTCKNLGTDGTFTKFFSAQRCEESGYIPSSPSFPFTR